jgi:hypothetical protein
MPQLPGFENSHTARSRTSGENSVLFLHRSILSDVGAPSKLEAVHVDKDWLGDIRHSITEDRYIAIGRNRESSQFLRRFPFE